MKLIVPEFNEIFLPPIIFEGLNDGAFSKYYKLPSSIKHSIVGYNIIEIPRVNKDDDGCLIISLSRNNMDTKSIWERMDETINISERNFSD